MSLQEKVEMIGGVKGFSISGSEQYGIPEVRMADGPVGIRNYGPSTAYPASVGIAASWDREIANKVGAAIGMESRMKNVHIMLGPGMNIHRGPLGGRNFEYLGEDPFLAGEIAVSFITGMQEQGVIATAKHYVANYQDYNRHNVSSDMDERTLHEIYLPAFRACVEKGNVGAVMTAYNLVNGIHCSEHNYLISKVLKETWGFKGIVMSDWTSTYNGLACALAGLDLEMPSGMYMHPDTLLPAVEAGDMSVAVIDDKIRRILNLYERFGFFDNPDMSAGYILDSAFVRSVALDAARGGITLLKNENRILPLDITKTTKIAVIGMNAHPAVTGGGGSSYTTPRHPVSLYQAMEMVGGNRVKVVHEPALFVQGKLDEDYFKHDLFHTYADGKKVKGVYGEFYANTKLQGEAVYSSVFTRLDHNLEDSAFAGVPEVNFSARFTCYFSVDKSGYYRMALAGDDGYRLILNGNTILEHWENQPETTRTTEIMLEAGKENKAVVEYYQSGGGASIRFAYDPSLERVQKEKSIWEDAVRAAETSDLVVIAAGFDENTEHEGVDRTWELPNGQSEMIRKISALNQNCIVVLNAGGNVDMPWLENIKGLIHAWYPGQEGNIAVAEIIFGITNPSGKLPVSFEKNAADNPTYMSYHDNDSDNRVFFSEGIFLGYRHFDKSEIKPLFPFGYGLSYTTFEYSALTLNTTRLRNGESLKLSFTVTNTGDADGAEICQVYVSDRESELPRPEKELKGFEKVVLKKGESTLVNITLPADAFAYYNPGKGGWITESGVFEIKIGGSSQSIYLTENVELVN